MQLIALLELCGAGRKQKGRGALKIIDKAKMYEVDELVTRASNRLTNSSCSKNAELEASIINFKYDQKVLEISGSKMPEPISVKLLKNSVKDCELAKDVFPTI